LLAAITSATLPSRPRSIVYLLAGSDGGSGKML
jgi:hypothetical protein